MKKYISYFDFLGFEDFINNNPIEYQEHIINNLFVGIERALGQGKYQGFRADLSNSRINCINFSDTIIFWTNDDSLESLTEIIEVAFNFNLIANTLSFPVRGSLVYGEIIHKDYREKNNGGGLYNVNSVFGKGIVEAHDKAEAQNWAGTVIDNSVLEKIKEPKLFLEKYAKKYKVPYKQEVNVNEEEYVFNLTLTKFDDEVFKNQKSKIETNFANHKKDVTDPRVKEKLAHTIKFLESFKE